jgi:hypothetical protein
MYVTRLCLCSNQSAFPTLNQTDGMVEPVLLVYRISKRSRMNDASWKRPLGRMGENETKDEWNARNCLSLPFFPPGGARRGDEEPLALDLSRCAKTCSDLRMSTVRCHTVLPQLCCLPLPYFQSLDLAHKHELRTSGQNNNREKNSNPS